MAQGGKDNSAKWLLLPAQASVAALGSTLSAQPGIEYCLSISNIAFLPNQVLSNSPYCVDIQKS